MRVFLFAALVACASSASIAARAQVSTMGNDTPRPMAPRTPPPPPPAFDRDGFLGLELALKPGISYAGIKSPVVYAPKGGDTFDDPGVIFSGTLTPYRNDDGIAVEVGYRFLPFLSAGIFLEYLSVGSAAGVDPDTTPDGTVNLQRAISMYGVYGRYYLTALSDRVHLWGQLGVGLTDDVAKYSRPSSSAGGMQIATDYQLEERGVIFPLTIGVDLRVRPAFALGPFVSYARVIPTNGCVERTLNGVTTGACTGNSGDAKIVDATGYGVFFGGVALKVTVGPSL